MAIIHGKATVFKIGTASSESDISAFCDDIEFPWDYDEAETTTFGTTGAKTYTPGNYESVVTITGKWDSTASTGLDAVMRANLGVAGKSIVWKPGNSTFTWSALGFLKSYKPKSPVNGVITFTAAFRVSGVITVT